MNITKNDTVKVICQPELGEGIVRDIFQTKDGPTRIIVSFGDQGKLDYFFPCELTKISSGCPKCGSETCRCKETKPVFNLPAEKFKIDTMFVLRLQDLLDIPARDLTTSQGNLIVEMYKLLK